MKLALFDISRAHFYGKAQREMYVTLPEGVDEEGKCAFLSRVWREHRMPLMYDSWTTLHSMVA